MPDVVVQPVSQPVIFQLGENTALAAQKATEAAASADEAAGYVDEILGFAGRYTIGDEVVDATAAATGRAVTVSGAYTTTGVNGRTPFSETVTLDAPATSTVTDAAHTLTYVNGIAAWPFLSTKLEGGNVTNLVVKDASTSAVLVAGTDYIADLRTGALGRATAGSPRNVLVSYTTSDERYDLIYVDPFYANVDVVKGTERTRDAAEVLPNIGTKMVGQTAIDMRLPLFNARVTASGVELVKLWNIRHGIAREYERQFEADRRRNQEAIRPLLNALEKGDDTIWSAMGDSITALQSAVPSATVPNGPLRDVAKASGTDNTYLREGIIGSDLVDAVPGGFNNGGVENIHTRFGRTWELLTAASVRYSGAIDYRNYSIAGTSADDAELGMTNPTRLAAWAGDGSDCGIIATGMNDIPAVSTAGGETQFFNRVRLMIDEAYEGGKKGVIVWGCSRPRGVAATDTNWLRVNRALRRAAETPGYGGRTAAFIDVSMIYYGEGAGSMGIALGDLCLANGFNHPGILQHKIEGEFGIRALFG
jgi:hypothetical protein